jgi:HAD superfamily hydrolase (TIGR01509 family)
MLIVFDYFGVIAQDGFWYQSKAIAKGHHKGKDISELGHKADLGDISWSEYCKGVAKDLKLPTSVVAKRYQEHQINELAVKLAHNLRENGHTIVLLSNASGEYLRPVMIRLGLDKLFDRIFVSSEMHLAKPDPLAYDHVLREMDYEAEEAVMIDDSQANINAAKDLGMHGILYTPGEELSLK